MHQRVYVGLSKIRELFLDNLRNRESMTIITIWNANKLHSQNCPVF